MKKILIAFLFILLFSFGNFKVSFAETNSYVKVLYSSIYIYSETNVETSSPIKEVTYGTKLKLLNQDQVLGDDGFLYYLVEVTDTSDYTSGYVFCSQVLSTKIHSPKKDLEHNATISKETSVYTYTNSNYVETGVKLNVNEKVRILDGYNISSQYIKIQYKDAEGDILTGYVKSEDVKTSGISRSTIGAIIIVVTTISLVLLLFGIKGKKKKSLLK